jgi:hypothetical protein
MECGAADGEGSSNSLFFEMQRNWTGVLIEADSAFNNALMGKHRRAHVVLNACLSPVKRAVRLPFKPIQWVGGLQSHLSLGNDHDFTKWERNVETLQCFPMASILQALGRRHVDMFALDIEGAEADVLETLPLDEILVDMFVIEHARNQEKIKRIQEFLVKKWGYTLEAVDTHDMILKRQSVPVSKRSSETKFDFVYGGQEINFS